LGSEGEVCGALPSRRYDRIKDGGHHHFIFLPSSNRQSEIANRKSGGGFKRLQRIGHDPGANDDLVCSAAKRDFI
jgi:hypothetical protein